MCISRDPTDEYFRRRHRPDVLSALGPYHAGLEPYHDLELPGSRGDCEAPQGDGVDDKWVPYTAIAIMFLVLLYSSVTSWTSSPAKVANCTRVLQNATKFEFEKR